RRPDGPEPHRRRVRSRAEIGAAAQRRFQLHRRRSRQVGARLPDHDGPSPRQALGRQPELGRHQQHVLLGRSEPRHRRRDPDAVPAVRRSQGARRPRRLRARRLSARRRDVMTPGRSPTTENIMHKRRKHMVTRSLAAALAAAAIMVIHSGSWTPAAAQQNQIPRFEVDPSWPKLPSKWVWGQVSSVSIDAQGHAWILQRPTTVRADQKAKGMAAPPVLEFDEAGNFLQAWGGPGQGYDWPETEHGIYADPKGFIWLGGNGRTDHHLVKFTRDGKFVMQIGRKGESKGNKDTQNVKQAADTFYHAPTNELFVADGYGNKRIVVFDADTGKFKRMWGAFGNEPLDNVPEPPKVPENQRIPAKEISGNGPEQFVRPVHAARVSNDGMVYVSDRGGRRVQVFTFDGKYVTKVFIDRYCAYPNFAKG